MQSTNDTGSFHGSSSEQWDHESGVFPKPRLRAKASSTLLGQNYGEDGATDTSSVSRHMRHEDSSSTLKSYYDRQKSPLSISQQTSASSARDLALRKGFPPVVSDIPRSPLLQVESSADIFEKHFVDRIQHGGDLARDGSTRKKPARLDLSMLFPSRNKRASKMSDGESLNLTPSSVSTHAPYTHGSQNPSSGRRKLTKAHSKESLRLQNPGIRSTNPYDLRSQRQTTDTLSSLYNSYEQLALSPSMSQIPESRVLEPQSWNDGRRTDVQPRSSPVRNPRERLEISSQPERRTKTRDHQNSDHDSHARRKIDSYSQSEQQATIDRDPLGSAEKEHFSWKHVRESMISPRWDSSAASISSRNTKTSRHTSTSAFSNSDLKHSSVLSLSSDSEEEASDREPVRSPADSSNDKASRVLNGAAQRPVESRRQPPQQPEQVSLRRQSTRKGAAQVSPFLTIPEASATSSRLSGPWSPPKLDNHQPATGSLDKREKRSKRTPSTSSKRSSNQPTPPQSPNSVTFRETETDNSRFMALTEQEAALVAALRSKKEKMRQKIIQEHETSKSPPRVPDRKTSRHSEASSVSTIRGPECRNDKQHILVYLDKPLNDGHAIDTAEPSPDLSDFLSFGSDEDSTPRTSWAPPRRGQPRPDSSAVSPDPRSHKLSPRTPPSAARLSAVGASVGFRNERSSEGLVPKKRNTNAGVRFVDDAKLVHPQDFLLDENEETDVIWGM